MDGILVGIADRITGIPRGIPDGMPHAVPGDRTSNCRRYGFSLSARAVEIFAQRAGVERGTSQRGDEAGVGASWRMLSRADDTGA